MSCRAALIVAEYGTKGNRTQSRVKEAQRPEEQVNPRLNFYRARAASIKGQSVIRDHDPRLLEFYHCCLQR